MKEQKKANLFLVGAMKAGTTSFMELIGQHPDVYVSPIKEPHFFVDDLPSDLYEKSSFFSVDEYFSNAFPAPLHIANVTNQTHYDQLFSLQNKEKYLLEGSTMYLHAPNVVPKIFEYNPNSKIIVLVRDPLERAFSHYKMLVGLSREIRSFEEVISEDIKTYNNGILPWSSCLAMSFYKTPVEQFKAKFKDVYMVQFEDLISNPTECVNGFFKNIGLDSLSNFETINTNPTRTLRFKRGMYLLKKLGLKDYFSAIFNSQFKQRIFRFVSSSKKEHIALKPETLEALKKIFEKESAL